MSDLLDFAARLREARDAKGLTQEHFAVLAGVSKNSQGQYEAGKTPPTVEYLYRLAGHGIDIGYLLTGEHAGAPLQVANLAEALTILDEAEARLDVEGDGSLAPGTELRRRLEGIALDQKLALKYRLNADRILAYLGDPVADQRKAERERRVMASLAAARDLARSVVASVAERHSIRLTPELENGFISLIYMLFPDDGTLPAQRDLEWPLDMIFGAISHAAL